MCPFFFSTFAIEKRAVLVAGFKTASSLDSIETLRPTNNALLMNFRLGSNAEIFVKRRRLSIRIRRPNVQKRVRDVYMFRLIFHFCAPPVGGWEEL